MVSIRLIPLSFVVAMHFGCFQAEQEEGPDVMMEPSGEAEPAAPPPQALNSEDFRQKIKETMRSNRDDVEDCYYQSLGEDNKAQGKLVVKFSVDPFRGRIRNYHVDRDASNIANTQLEECIQGKLMQWSFVRPPGSVKSKLLIRSNFGSFDPNNMPG